MNKLKAQQRHLWERCWLEARRCSSAAGEHWIMGMLGFLCSDSSKVSCCWKVLTHLTLDFCLFEVVERRFTRAFFSASSSISGKQPISRPPDKHLLNLEENWKDLRNEFERALHAGSVMEKTLLESSQIESYQQNFGSVIRIRHGKLS